LSDTGFNRESDGKKDRYLLEKEGQETELTYSVLNPVTVIADHTPAPRAGQALVELLVADARAEGFRIVPLCPFVKAQRRNHPGWTDTFSA
jgi:predicted GNAT family acetyltransferase